MKKFLLLSLSALLLLVSCGGESTPPPTSIDPSTSTEPETSDSTSGGGGSTVTGKERFIQARAKTILNSSSFKYSSTTHLQVSYGTSTAIALNGNQSGTTSYNSASDVSYLEEHENSGSLFYDGFKTTYEKNNTLYEIKENEDHDLTGYTTETVTDDFRYEGSSFAKVLFEYEEDDIKDVELASNGKYEITTKMSFSSIAKTVLNQVNNPIIAKILDTTLPETESSFHMYTTYGTSDYLASYSYLFDIIVSGVRVALTYDLTFTAVGSATVSISEPNFPNLYLSDEQVNTALTTISSGITAYKTQQYSGYTYRIDSTMDVVDKKSVGVTTQGKTKRQVSNNVVYYDNRVEVDSEHKDADMYGESDTNVVDYERYRAKIADGTVYDCEDRAWPLSNLFTEVTNPSASDEFYGIIDNSLLTTEYVEAIQMKTETAGNEYSFVINNDMVTSIFDYVNEITRLDPTLAKHYLALGKYDASTLLMNDATFTVVINNGLLVSMFIELKGTVDTNFEDSRDSIAGSSDFNVSIEITTDDSGANYVIPESTGDILLD